MLIAQNLLPPFHLMVRVCNAITTVIYTQPKNEKLKSLGYLAITPKAVSRFPVLIKASVLFAILIFSQILYDVKFSGKSKVNALTIVPSLLFFFSVLAHIPQLIEHYIKRHECCAGFNEFVDFERRHNAQGWLPQEAITGKGRRIRRYINILHGITLLVPLSHWKNQIDVPCFPGNLGYIFLSECSGNTNTNDYEKIQKILMSTFSALLYLFTTATSFIQYELLVMLPYCIMNYIRLFEHKLENQLAISNNPVKTDKLFLMYREIELLVGFFNWFHGRTLIFSYVLDSSAAFIISLYTVVGLSKDLPVAATVNCGILVLLAIAALKDFDGLKTGVFQISKNLITKVSRQTNWANRKLQVRRIRSWRVLRIYMGTANFYDAITPLTLGDFCVQNTVTLLLL